MNYQLAIILISTAILIVLSWRSLRYPDYHGFYRFFAWELIIVQISLALPVWFKEPFSWHQLISWFLLGLSLPVLYQAVSGLKQSGGERIRRASNQNYIFENTTKLVTQGIYARIRHPMYCSLLLLSWGVFFKNLSWWGILLVALASLCLYATARIEEKENITTFGVTYLEYMKNSKMFIPYLF
jgi:protein-S-isoprenylcysteine O-methyltransferase Ste14